MVESMVEFMAIILYVTIIIFDIVCFTLIIKESIKES